MFFRAVALVVVLRLGLMFSAALATSYALIVTIERRSLHALLLDFFLTLMLWNRLSRIVLSCLEALRT
jgi:hypothetical protein